MAKIKPGDFCLLIKKDCIGLKCAWYTQVRGLNPNTGEEIDEWKAKDPIERFQEIILSSGLVTQSEIETLIAKVREGTRDAIKEASAAPDSDPAELLSSVFREAN